MSNETLYPGDWVIESNGNISKVIEIQWGYYSNGEIYILKQCKSKCYHVVELYTIKKITKPNKIKLLNILYGRSD
jgi:hypothetical protein